MHFAVADVTVHPLVPVLVAYCVSTVTSMGGISGAVVLLPFQVSFLGFTGPAVTPTNLLFNVVAIPPGVIRHVREGRLLWPLAVAIAAGTVPGVLAGAWVRVTLLEDPRHFKLFIAVVLGLVGVNLARKVLTGSGSGRAASPRGPGNGPRGLVSEGDDDRIRVQRADRQRLEYVFRGASHGVSMPAVLALAAVVGVLGGIYGVGGGALMAPFLVSVFGLPVHTIAGATLLGTLVTSLVGVASFSLAGTLAGLPSAAPDWPLGLLLGLGGLGGVYTGTRIQRFVPARFIEALLALLLFGLAGSYFVGRP